MPMLADLDRRRNRRRAPTPAPTPLRWPGRLGGHLATVEVRADAAGYAELAAFAAARAPGPQVAWAIEGCGSHGAGLARALADAGQLVIEADRPKRARRRGGKSDELDAVRAARQALATADPARPRTGETREALRILLATREYATKTRTATVNTFKALVLTAPDSLRDKFRRLPTDRQVRAAKALRARPGQPVSEQHLHRALAQLATQITSFDADLAASLKTIRGLVQAWIPALLDQPGVGPISAAQLLVTWSHHGRFRSEAAFAALTGAPHPSPHPRAGPAATGSTPTATGTPTGPCTPSRSAGSATTHRPSPTPPAAPATAKPPAKSAAASSATSPAASTASWSNPPLDKP
ncbi:MAG: transposase [Pseudonocardiales bacterium]